MNITLILNTLKIIVGIYAIYKLLYLIIFNYTCKEDITKLASYSKLKFKNLSAIKKFNISILNMNCSFKILGKNIISPISVTIFSVIIFTISFVVFFLLFKVFSTSILMAMFFSIIPYNLLKYFSYSRKRKILNTFPIYALSLKRYTDISGNIIEAISKASCDELIQNSITKFNISIQNGLAVYDAFEELKQDINIPKISNFITLLEHSYTNGGNFSKLLEHFSILQSKENLQKEEESKNSFSSKLTLIFLILLNMYVVFGFAFNMQDYKEILTTTLAGKAILNFNVISYIIILIIYTKLNKLEE